jgi:hypothetical protein
MKSTSITSEVKRMTEKLHFIKIEATGFQDICDRLAGLEQENEFLDKQNKALKLRCGKYCLENKELRNEIEDLKFTKNFLSSEDAGKMLARSLGVGQ